MYQSRTIENYIKKIQNQFPVLLLTGARQVGKTTVLKHLSDDKRKYVTLDDPLILQLAKEDPALFFQRFQPPLLIDEIQYAPELLPYIKIISDNSEEKGLFWLTGSQQFQLMKGISESLAGRVAILQLLGFSYKERIGKSSESVPFLPNQDKAVSYKNSDMLNLEKLYKLIWQGSMPTIAINEDMDRDLYYSSYLQTYLQRDVRDLAKVGDEIAFVRFLRITASRTGQLLNYADLARDADIAPNTAKNWISILLASGIIYLLEPYFNNITKRMVKTPKLYFLDTGLCAYLTGWSNPDTLESGAMSGAFFETWIVSEMLKSYLHNGLQPPFFFFRSDDKKEIDVLIETDGTIYPVEIKKTASPSKNHITSFSLVEKFGKPVGLGGVVCLATESLPITENAISIPAGVI
ncbi:MAG: ATP-binding protein [Armatimonadota bacterium]